PFPKDVPTVTLKKISLQNLLKNDEKESGELFNVLTNEGFFYLNLTSHELGRQFLDESNQLHHIAADVFNNVPMKDKAPPGHRRIDTDAFDSYICQSVDDNGEPDMAEFLNVSCWGLNHDENYYIPPWLRNQRELFRSFAANGNAIGQVILKTLERELHLYADELTNIHQPEDYSGGFVRLFRYPAPKDGKPHSTAPTPAHTDATSMTLLFNWQGGLQITKRQGQEREWLYIPPEPGHVIVNLGDTMLILSNGVLKSGRHRVVTPPGPQAEFHRYSVLTNLRPSNDTPMRALKSDMIPSGEDGEIVTAREWSLAK
ncbi:Clavaminate synthase-like protein, partial [Lophiostoma macrostomum CBS 122681]